MTIQPLQYQIAKQIQTLSGEQVKAAVMQWLLNSDATIIGLNQHLMITTEKTPLEIMEAAGFIGCFEAEADFSQQSEEMLRSSI